jgi:hypothetical protein
LAEVENFIAFSIPKPITRFVFDPALGSPSEGEPDAPIRYRSSPGNSFTAVPFCSNSAAIE